MAINLNESGERVASWQEPLLDLISVFLKRRELFLLLIVGAVVFGVYRYTTTPKIYRSSTDAVLLPREKPIVDLQVMASSVETSEDSAKRADSGSLMLPAQTDLYISLMGSRSVLERIAREFESRLPDLTEVKPNDRSDEIVMRLRKMIDVKGTDEGMLTVTVTAENPHLAADIADLLIREAQEASKSIERQLLLQQAGYLGKAVTSSETKLERVETRLKAFCERHSILHPEMQANDHLRQIRELTAILDKANVELIERRLHYTESDPGVQQLVSRLAVTELRISELRNTITGDVGERQYGDIFTEYQGLVQEVRFRRDLLATLSTQADVFQIRAEQPAGNIAVVRPAVPVLKPAGPSKKVIFGFALAVALSIGAVISLLLEQLQSARADPAVSGRLDEIVALMLRPIRFSRLSPFHGNKQV